MLLSLQVRDSPENIFIPIITCMREHPTNGDIARSSCQLLLDLYYVSLEEKEILENKKLYDPKYGKAAPGGNTVDEVMDIWGVHDIEKLWGPPPKPSKREDSSPSDQPSPEKEDILL